MTLDKLKRVMWRLQEMQPGRVYTHSQIRRAIMEEMGTDDRTIKTAMKRLTELKMLTPAEFGKMRNTLHG